MKWGSNLDANVTHDQDKGDPRWAKNPKGRKKKSSAKKAKDTMAKIGKGLRA
jgi:signal recognition particle subunit SEC65